MFERLTNRNESGIAYAKIPTNPSNMIDVGECYTGRIIDRLAAYEDTGLTPERIRAYVAELQNAFNILFESERQKQQENEQLRAQVAQYREALIIANPRIPDTDYHNPADVELLRKARKALHKGISELKVHCKPFDQTPEEDACIEMHEAVVEIDRAIGGEESEGKER